MEEILKAVQSMPAVYELFLTELESHVKLFQETLAELNSAPDLEALGKVFIGSAKKLEHRFHVIKGGSGFLKLDRIRELSIEGESWFKNAMVHSENFLELKDEFSALTDNMKKELSALQELLARAKTSQ